MLITDYFFPIHHSAFIGHNFFGQGGYMARLPYLDRDQLPEMERDIFDNLLAQRGSIGNIFRTVAHSPLLLRRMLYFSDGLRNRTRLDRRFRELAIMTVGRLTNCEYEYVHHQALAKRVGVRPEQVERLA